MNLPEFTWLQNGRSNSIENMNSIEIAIDHITQHIVDYRILTNCSPCPIQMDGVTNTDVPPIVPSVEDEIEWLCNLPAEDLEIAKGSSKLSGISLARAKQLSVHMSLNRCFNKSILIDNIIKKRKRVSELAAVHSSETVDQDSDDGKESKFISNVNTFPRICNIILDHPDALIRSALLASKYALQNKETNQNQPIFKEAKEKFNDISYNSGGIISDHPELLRAKIDPELHNTSGKITSKHLFKTFNNVIRQYAIIIPKYTASGQHNQHDFFSYCHGNVNALYLHSKLKSLGNPELNSFCAEGTEVDGRMS